MLMPFLKDVLISMNVWIQGNAFGVLCCLICEFFLAPSGAQERLMFVRMFGSSLSRALNFHLSRSGLLQVALRSLLGLS